MAGPVSYDRVMELTLTTGTGALTLAGAANGFRAFSVVGDGNTCPYAVWAVDENGVPTGDWETGVGTYAASGATLARSVLQSSNGNALVDFAAGMKRVAITPLADLTVQCDANPGTTGQVLTSRGTGLLPRWATPTVGPTDGDKGDVTVSASGATWTIDANVVSDAKFRQSAGLSVVARAANTTGNVADLVAASDGQVLHRNGSILEFGALNLGGTNAVTGTAGTINGGTGNSGLTTYAVLCGGTTTFGAAQQVSGLGSAGAVLTSNGAGSLPTWQSAAGALTTRGDMLYRNSVTAARLPVGTSKQFLRTDFNGLEPEWADDARIVSLTFSGMVGVSAPTSSAAGTGGGLNAAFAWDTQAPRLFLAGPAGATSPPAAPTWRGLAVDDLPNASASGSFGDATSIPVLTFNTQGVLQAATTVTVDIVALGGLTVFDLGVTVQAWDAGLDALAAFNTNGVICQTAQDVYAGRTLTGTTNRLTVTNGDGVAGNPTFDVSSGYVGQATITTLGTVTTGTWNGTAIANAYLANSSLTVTAGTGLTGGGSVSLGGSTTLNVAYGTSSSTACVGNDSRLSDARTPVGTALTSAKIWVGDSGNLAAAVAVSGDVTIDNAGATTIGAGKVTNAMLAGSIANAKLANSSVTVTAGTGLTGGGSVALGATVTLTVAYGTSSTTACVGNDSRLSDARTPVGTALTSANVWVGNGSNVAAAVAVSGDVTITNAGVTAIGSAKVTETMLALPPHVAEGRLTLTSGTAVTTSDVTAATSVYYAIYQGNQITLYDGSVSKRVTFTEQTLSLSGLTVGRTYDVFGYISSGVLAIEALGWTAPATGSVTGATNATPIVITSNGHGLSNGQLVTITGVGGNTAANGTFRVAAAATNTFSLNTEAGVSVAGSGVYTSGGTWTRVDQATSRATALTTQDGYLVKTGDATRRYLGTFRITRTAGQTEDSAQRRLLWNCYNRVLRKLKKVEATASWTTTSATFLCANGTTANRLEIVVGLVEDVVHLHLAVYTNNSGTAADYASIGINSITTSDADLVAVTAGASTTFAPAVATLDHLPDVGYTFYQWTESTAAGTATFFGTTGFIRCGLSGFVRG